MLYDRLLDEKRVLITGGGAGLGAACARLFADHGARVVVADETAEGEAIVSGLRGEADAEALCKAYLARFDAPDVWLNCARTERYAYADELTEGDLLAMTEANVLFPVRLARLLAPEMGKRGGGSVVQLASDYALTGAPSVSAFAATMGALVSATRALAAEYAPVGVRMNALLPGLCYSSAPESRGRDDEEAWRNTQMLQWRGTDADLANAALFLASDLSRLVNAEALFVNAGQDVIPHNQPFYRRAWG